MNIFNPELEVFMENGKKTVDSTVHDSAQSMKDSNRVGCSIREHLKNVRQRTDLNFCNNPRLSRAALRRSSQKLKISFFESLTPSVILLCSRSIEPPFIFIRGHISQ